MVVLTRFSLPWVPHTWMSGTNPLQTPRAWFWGTHKWAISAALLTGGVSRNVGNVLVFDPLFHRSIELRSSHQSSWDGYSVCSSLSWGERWWSVGVMAADGVCPGLGCILKFCRGRWPSFYYGLKFWLFCRIDCPGDNTSVCLVGHRSFPISGMGGRVVRGEGISYFLSPLLFLSANKSCDALVCQSSESSSRLSTLLLCQGVDQLWCLPCLPVYLPDLQHLRQRSYHYTTETVRLSSPQEMEPNENFEL